MQYRMTQPEYQRILDFKRDMHMHPELSHHEFRTTEKIKEFLSSIPSCRILPLHVGFCPSLWKRVFSPE